MNIKIILKTTAILFLSCFLFATTSFSEESSVSFGLDWRTATLEDVEQVNVEALNQDRKTPLHFAAAYSVDSEIITALINKGAEPGELDKESRAPLHFAVIHNPNPEIITALIKEGVNLNIHDKYGRSPLHYAAAYGTNPEIITALVRGNADLQIEDFFGHDVLDYASVFNSSSAMVTTLIKAMRRGQSFKKEKGREGSPLPPIHALYLAASFNPSADVITALINEGLDPNVQWISKGPIPLHYASLFNPNADVITALIKGGANPNLTDKRKNSPLHYVAGWNKEVVSEFIEDHYFTLQIKSPLFRAKAYKNMEEINESGDRDRVVVALLKGGADLEAKNRSRKMNTPLLVGLKKGTNPEVIVALIDAGKKMMTKKRSKKIKSLLKRNKALRHLLDTLYPK